MRTMILAFAGLLATTAVAHAAPNLVLNGDFENTSGLTGSSEFGASYPGRANAVVDWTSPHNTAFNLVFFDDGKTNTTDASTRFDPAHGGETGQYLWTSTTDPLGSGGKFIALDGDTGQSSITGPVVGTYNGPFNQTINGLVNGHTYTLSFDWAGAQYRDRSGNTTDEIFASLGGGTAQGTGVISNLSHSFTGWRNQKFTFTATGASEVLSFLAVGAPNGLPPVSLLDNVTLNDTTNIAVPEPAALALFGLGVIGLGASRLRRR